jgi:uncharacterized protein YggE
VTLFSSGSLRAVARIAPFGVLLALAPLLGSAQVVPAPVVVAPGVPGQALSTGGLTVSGRATIAVPADRMSVAVRLSPHNVTNGALDGLAKSVADTMRGAGIGDAREVLPLVGFLGPNSQVAVLGTIEHPTRTAVETILRSVLATIPDATAAAVGNNYQVTTSLLLDDCSGAEMRAQTAAFEDARARAQRAATAAGIHLGAIVAIVENSAFSDIACRANADGQNAGVVVNFAGGGGDPYGSLTIPVTATASVTYAIR